MASLTNAGAARYLEGATRRIAVTAATTYLALLTAAPDRTTTVAQMAEVTAAGYARQAATWAAPGGNAATGLAAPVTFGPLTTGATVTHLGLVTAATGTTGSLYAWWELPTPVVVAAGGSFTLNTADVVLWTSPVSWASTLGAAYSQNGLDAVTGRAATSALTTRQLALATGFVAGSTTMGSTNGVPEVFTSATNGYARADVVLGVAAGDPVIAPLGAATFGPFTAATGVVTHAVALTSTTTTAPVHSMWALPPSHARAYAVGESLVLTMGDLIYRAA